MVQKRHEKSKPCLGNIRGAGRHTDTQKGEKVYLVLKAELHPYLDMHF